MQNFFLYLIFMVISGCSEKPDGSKFSVCSNDLGQVNIILLESSKFIVNHSVSEDLENRVVNVDIQVKPILIGSKKKGSISFKLGDRFDDLIVNGRVISIDSINTCPEDILEVLNGN